MKLQFFHYYFRERNRRTPPRKIHDIRPLLNAYIAHGDTRWKSGIVGQDNETLMLLRPSTTVYMLIGTRDAEIIKAITTSNLACADISDRLLAGEKTGFACYFRADERRIALAGTLRGPRAAALSRFVQDLMDRLGARDWKFCMQSLATSITIEQARAMAFVSRASIKVRPGNPLFQRLIGLFGADHGEIGAFIIGINGKKSRNVKNVVDRMAQESGQANVDKFTVRAKAALDDDLADFYVYGDGRLSDDISPGNETHIVSAVSRQFTNEQSVTILANIIQGNFYDDVSVPELDRLGERDHWLRSLRSDADSQS